MKFILGFEQSALNCDIREGCLGEETRGGGEITVDLVFSRFIDIQNVILNLSGFGDTLKKT